MEQANNAGSEASTDAGAGGNRSRRKALTVIVAVFLVIGAGWFAWWSLVLSKRETTTDAYVAGNQVAVSAQVPGTVVALMADDTQRVEAGQELLRLDATDAQLTLQRTAAVLAQAVRAARQQSATASQYDALVEQRRAELQGAEAQLARRQPLLASQAVSAEEVKQAGVMVDSARAALLATQRQAASAHALTADLKPDQQPAVAEARAQYEQAWVAAHRHRVLAPVSGYVARRTVQAGQHVAPGAALLTIVPLESVWVDANFKEAQLRALRLGQRAKVRADVYGNDVVYAGRVAGVAAGTGSAFSLLPAQNASGNWVKVVQRVPVRIELDGTQLAKYPLRIGLSMAVEVDTTDRSGGLLPTEATHTQVAGTTLYDTDAKAASSAAEAILRGTQPARAVSDSAPPASTAEPAPLRGATLVLLTVAISLATFMEVLDMTIVNVSIPAIAGTLAVSPTEGTWTISSYSLAAAIMQPLTGWLGRRLGEVRTFAVSGLLFVVFSTLCGFASSMSMLVIGRILQGLVSGPMVPMAQALLLRSYPPQKRGVAMAMWAMVVFIAPICGPVLGGWITDNFSWPWLFFINAPVGLFAIGVSWSLLRKRESKRTRVPIDGVGLALLVVGVGSLQFVLDRGNELDWFQSSTIIAAGCMAVVAITLLIAWELTDRHPVLDLHLFAHRNFSVGIASICLGFFCFFGAVVAYPLWLQTTVGYSAVWAGLATAPVGLLGLILMPMVGANLHRMNARLVATIGFLTLSTVMFWAGSLNAQADFWHFVYPRLLQGVGLSCFFMPLQQIMFSDVKMHELAAASGLSSFLRNIAGSVSTALSVFMWTERTDYHHAILAEGVQQGAAWSDWATRFGGVGGGDTSLLMAYTQFQVAHEAQTLAINDVMHTFGIVLLVLAPTIWLARPPRRGQPMAAGH